MLTNVNLKKVVWDSVGRDNWKTLTAKIIAGMLSNFVGFSAIKYFPLTYCNLMRNVSPFYALIFSALFLAEPASFSRCLLLLATVGLGLGFVLAANIETDMETHIQEEDEEPAWSFDSVKSLENLERIFAWFCLISTPIFIAVNSAMNRALRKLDENTVTTY